MRLDKRNLFSDAQAVTSSAVASTNVIETGGGSGAGNPVGMAVQVVEAFAGGTSLKVGIETCATEGFSSGVVTLVESTLALAALTAGARFPLNFLPEGDLGFIRLKYTPTGTFTAGKLTAGLTDGRPSD